MNEDDRQALAVNFKVELTAIEKRLHCRSPEITATSFSIDWSKLRQNPHLHNPAVAPRGWVWRRTVETTVAGKRFVFVCSTKGLSVSHNFSLDTGEKI
jgi:hypothetical protein